VLLGRFAHLGFWERRCDDAQRVAARSRDVGLETLRGARASHLVGGEQRRAAIARLLVQAPSIYLLDEPTNHLDPAQQLGILEPLRALTREGARSSRACTTQSRTALRRSRLPAVRRGHVDLIDCAALGTAISTPVRTPLRARRARRAALHGAG
jgi:iron complex transport system ATP-binding protein